MTTPARFQFVGGKGGVGKTTCAAALAVREAERGSKVLVVSADPAHSLGDALQVRLAPKPRKVKTQRGQLWAAELDARAALDEWLEPRRDTLRIIGERGTYLDREDLDRFLHLSLPGIDELMALLELWRRARDGAYDLVVVDTAPTGHLLRMLQTPRTLASMARVFDGMEEKHRVMAATLGGTHVRDAADALVEELAADAEELTQVLRDRERTRLSWVLLPEALSVAETRQAVGTLSDDGIAVDELIVNRVTPPPPRACAQCRARRAEERTHVLELLDALPSIRTRFVPALTAEPRGVPKLRAVARALSARDAGRALIRPTTRKPVSRPSRVPKIRNAPPVLEVPRSVRLLLFGGKGGVGKSTCSAAQALVLARARPDARVTLLSIDPARRMGDVLGMRLTDTPAPVKGGPPNLSAQQLDAEAAFAREKLRYVDAVDSVFDAFRQGSRFDASYDRAVLRDLIDLAPPGLDELFALFTVMDTLFPPARANGPAPKAEVDLLVVDTAPTGHALRLLELPAIAHEWTRALLAVLLKYRHAIGLGRVAEDVLALAKQLRQLQATLADPALSQFVVVTRTTSLARAESERLLASLQRLRLHVPAVLVNAVPDEECGHPNARPARAELAALKRMLRQSTPPPALVLAPEQLPPPHGPRALEAFAQHWAVQVG